MAILAEKGRKKIFYLLTITVIQADLYVYPFPLEATHVYLPLTATFTLCLIRESSSVFVNHCIVVFSFRFVYSQYAVKELFLCIKLHSETQVSGSLGMSRGISLFIVSLFHCSPLWPLSH